MRMKLSILVLIVLLSGLMLSACDPSIGPASASASADPALRVTPIDNSAAMLIVTVNIDEDQDATDAMSNITMQFRTAAIEENNYINFYHGEKITCNGVTVKLNDSPMYTFKVARGDYSCLYTGYKKGTGLLDAVSMFNEPARSTLSPHGLSVRSQNYTIKYTSDSSSMACPISASAISDGSNSPIQGSASTSSSDVYTGPDTSALSGHGEILLQRTCSRKLHGSFNTIDLTYQSSASVEVTWSH